MTTNYLFSEGKQDWFVGYTVLAVNMDKLNWSQLVSNQTLTRHFMHLTYLLCNGKPKVRCVNMMLCKIPCLLYSCDLFPQTFLFRAPTKKGEVSPGFTKQEMQLLLPAIREFFAVNKYVFFYY